MGLGISIDSGTTSLRLLERDSELEAIDRALEHARDGAGGLIAIAAPAGVGKTTVLDAARTRAAEAGLFILHARGAELEREFVFGVVRQLFDEVLRDTTIERSELFAGAARFAAPLLDVEHDGATAPSEPFAARHAFYWLAANLAGQRPVALFVDDAHWADPASLGVLAHIANRLEGIPAVLIVAFRTEEALPGIDALQRQAEELGTLLELPPLGHEAAAIVVRTFVPDADDALCRACHVATGGNPFLLNELARSIAGDRSVGGATRVIDQSPERVTREMAARLGRLPDAARRLAHAAAVLGGGIPVREAAAVAGVDEYEAAEAADALVTAGVLRSSHPVEFLHPLVRAAVYAGLGPAARSRAHASAARQLADEAASPERVAAQLLRCQPAADGWACERLVAAARLAAARGAAEAAATYLRRALEEPPPPDSRTELLLELGAAEAMVPEPGAAVAHLREALTGEVDVEQRFRSALLLAGMLGHTARAPEAVSVLEEQIDALADRPDLRGSAEAAFTNVTRTDPTTRPLAAGVVDRLWKRVEDGNERDRAVLGTIAAEMGMAGCPAEAVAAVAAQAVVGFDGTDTGAAGWSGWNAIRSLVVAEHYDEALRVLDRTLEVARERGGVLDVGSACTFRGELYVRVGDLAAAEIDARTLLEISVACGWPLGVAFATGHLCEVLVERGELDEAARMFEDGAFAGPPTAVPTVYPSSWLLLARGRLRLAQGRPEDAAEDLRESGRRALEIDHVSPAVVEWRSQLAHVLMDLGQVSEARRLAAEELKLAREVGAPRALSVALRGAAHAEGGDEELRLLREAVQVVEDSPAQLERARAHAALGTALRHAGNPEGAREQLRTAVELAHLCGANALEDTALGELRATGARPRRRVTTGADALTPSERRIAELAAAGQQNREIAEALFVTTHTVEFHLRNAYRKLGIASRTELGRALG